VGMLASVLTEREPRLINGPRPWPPSSTGPVQIARRSIRLHDDVLDALAAASAGPSRPTRGRRADLEAPRAASTSRPSISFGASPPSGRAGPPSSRPPPRRRWPYAVAAAGVLASPVSRGLAARRSPASSAPRSPRPRPPPTAVPTPITETAPPRRRAPALAAYREGLHGLPRLLVARRARRVQARDRARSPRSPRPTSASP
jgi:hypothetical protein